MNHEPNTEFTDGHTEGVLFQTLMTWFLLQTSPMDGNVSENMWSPTNTHATNKPTGLVEGLWLDVHVF